MPARPRLRDSWVPPDESFYDQLPKFTPEEGERIKQSCLDRIQEEGIPEHGLGIDLVDATDCMYPLRSYDDVKNEREGDFCLTEMYSPRMVARTRIEAEELGKTGMQCERPECKMTSLSAHMFGVAIRLRRCSRCLQVNYCGTECQQQDWRRHKQYCLPAQPGTTKDGLFAGVRALLSCPMILASLKEFAAVTLNLGKNPLAGLFFNFNVHCTSIPDTVRGSGRIFQLSRVSVTPCDVSAAQMKNSNVPGPCARFVFTSDAPGSAGSLIHVTPIEPEVLTFAREPNPGAPVSSLLEVNGAIRWDVDDVFKFRMND